MDFVILSGPAPVEAQFMPPAALSTVRVVIVDDDELFAESLIALLADDDAIDVVGWVSNGADAVDLVAVEEPDVVVMDLAMPGMNGVEAAKIIGRETPETRIVMMSGSIVGTELEQMAGETGAAAYVAKARVAIDLVPALKTAASAPAPSAPK
jgi:two-component system, NarL family, nitrate/nitrite response regulator NarL